MRERVKLHPPDIWLIVTVIALVVAGLWLVYDASYAKAADSRTMNYDAAFLFKKQAMFALIGFAGLILASKVSYKRLKWLALPVLCAAVVLLVVVLAIGHSAHGAKSWLRLGFLMFQPSEVAKIGLVLYLALSLSPARTFQKNKPKRWVVPALVSAVLIGLIVLERDLGTAVLLVGMALCMFYAAGAKKWALGVTIAGMMVVGTCSFVFFPHVAARWRAFSDPWKYRLGEGYQTVHALAGISTGGLTGVGLCEGRTKFYMPATSTDYIFATLVEETGLIGGLGMIALFCLFSYRGLAIAHRSKSTYGSILATGIVSVVSVQAGINMAVVSAAIPPTGLSLPFISYGGSGMIAMLTCAGILLAVSRQVDVGGDRLESEESSSGRRRHGGSRVSGHKRGTGSAGGGSAYRVAVRR
jgi:cell division protein FtsW